MYVEGQIPWSGEAGIICRDAENQPGQEGLWAVEVVSQGFGHGFGKGHADLGQCSLRGHFVP